MKVIEKIEEQLLDVICNARDEYGSDYELSMQQLKSKIDGSIKNGRLEKALRSLVDKDFIYIIWGGKIGYILEHENAFSAASGGYDYWLENFAAAEPKNEDWQPVEVENYEELAEKSEELAKALDEDNGYKSTYPAEATSTIETIHSFAKVLKKDEGKPVRKGVQVVWQFLERAATIFDRTTRVGKLLYVFMRFIAFILGIDFS